MRANVFQLVAKFHTRQKYSAGLYIYTYTILDPRQTLAGLFFIITLRVARAGLVKVLLIEHNARRSASAVAVLRATAYIYNPLGLNSVHGSRIAGRQ